MTHLNHFTLFNNRKSLFPRKIRIKPIEEFCVVFVFQMKSNSCELCGRRFNPCRSPVLCSTGAGRDEPAGLWRWLPASGDGGQGAVVLWESIWKCSLGGLAAATPSTWLWLSLGWEEGGGGSVAVTCPVVAARWSV